VPFVNAERGKKIIAGRGDKRIALRPNEIKNADCGKIVRKKTNIFSKPIDKLEKA
jgi:hypothetical protein